MNKELKIVIDEFDYPLPDNRIAQFPLEKRENSKLLVCKGNKIEQDLFYNIKNRLPQNSLLVFNNTKVIHARIKFKKDTGSQIEIFCLEPSALELNSAFQQKEYCDWKCLVGNNKRWKSEKLKIEKKNIILFAERIKQEDEYFIIRFSWQPETLAFAEILEVFGKVPLPPYINRDTDEDDEYRYQTVFAKIEGSVAAPTAGLHFTEKILEDLGEQGIQKGYLTLHVGAGTFKPVTASNIAEHEMHEEHFSVSSQMLEHLLEQKKKTAPVIPVGTTSLRTVESLYWLGVKRILNLESRDRLGQWESYKLEKSNLSVTDAITALLDHLNKSGSLQLNGSTKMIIVPGYDFKIADGIVTNFHQPRSTLLLLVAAMIGEKWKEVYQYALDNEFRFLSYGDCCLFFK